MSNVPGYRRGVPVWQLVALILVILASGIISYIFYDERVRRTTDLDGAKNELTRTLDGIKTRTAEVDEIYRTMGVTSQKQVDMLLGDFDPKNLEELVKKLLADRQALIGDAGVVLTAQVDDGQGNKTPKFLETYVDPAVLAGQVPAELNGKKVGDLIHELIRHKKAMADREKYISEGQQAVNALNKQIVDKREETRTTLIEWTKKEVDAWAQREKSRDQLRFDPLKWGAERSVLAGHLGLEQVINDKLVKRLATQKNMATPIDGRVVAYDWRTRRGTLNRGARDKVKSGYEFDVYGLRPGPDRPDKRVHHGRIRLIDVYPESSLFVVIQMNEDNPVGKNDYASSQLYDETRRKTFVIKGWFPPDGEFSKAAIAGMIERDGGIVKDDLALDTDYLILGQMGGVTLKEPGVDVPKEPDAEELKELSPEAQRLVREAYQAYLKARHEYVTVLTVDTFKRYMNRRGTQASR